MIVYSSKPKQVLKLLPLMALAAMLLLSPAVSIAAAREALQLFATVVLPSLFPFIVCSQLLLKMRIDQALGFLFAPMAKFLDLPKSVGGAFITSVIAGYPSGALSVTTLYQRGVLRHNLQTAIALCSTAGPMFVIGMLGTSLLGSTQAGWMILLSHYNGLFMAAFATNIIMKAFKWERKSNAPITALKQKPPETLDDIITRSCMVMLKIGGFIVIFRVLGDILFTLPVLRPLLDASHIAVLQPLLRGMLEMADGCAHAATLPFVPASLVMCFIISFGGICIYFQSLSMLSGLPIRKGVFLLSKVLHGIFSAFSLWVMLLINPLALPTSGQTTSGIVPILSLAPTIRWGAYAFIAAVLLFLILRQCPRIWLRFWRTMSKFR